MQFIEICLNPFLCAKCAATTVFFFLRRLHEKYLAQLKSLLCSFLKKHYRNKGYVLKKCYVRHS